MSPYPRRLSIMLDSRVKLISLLPQQHYPTVSPPKPHVSPYCRAEHYEQEPNKLKESYEVFGHIVPFGARGVQTIRYPQLTVGCS